MPQDVLYVGDLRPKCVSAHDDVEGAEIAWASLLDDHRDGVRGRALPATLTGPDGRVLIEATVAEVEKRRAR